MIITRDYGDGVPVALGQSITFQCKRINRSSKSVTTTSAMNTVKKIASKKGGGVKNARAIADYNGITSIVFKMKPGRKIKLPGYLVTTTDIQVDILAGDDAPQVTGGYAKWEILDRWGRAGILQFDGYDPITIDIPVRFEWVTRNTERVPNSIEDAIEALEQMAGRGNFPGASTGRPGVIELSCRNNQGDVVPLIPPILQTIDRNDNPPKWVITNIQWANSPPDGVLRNRYGNRIRQTATITLQQYVQGQIIGGGGSQQIQSTGTALHFGSTATNLEHEPR